MPVELQEAEPNGVFERFEPEENVDVAVRDAVVACESFTFVNHYSKGNSSAPT